MKYFFWPILISSLFAACSPKVELDESQAETFNKFFGNSGQDQVCEILEMADGSLLLFGTTETGNKSTELVLIKTDRFGNEQWNRKFGRGAEDFGGGMDIADNGNIIMVGTSTKENPEPGNSTDLIIVEVDGSGTLTTGSNYLPSNPYYYDGGNEEEGNVILYDKYDIGGFVAAGSSDKENSFSPDNTANNNLKGTKDFMALRVFLADGNIDVNEINAGFTDEDFLTDGIQLQGLEGLGSDDFVFTGKVSKNGILRPAMFRLENKAESNSAFADFDDLSELSNTSVGQSILQGPSGLFITGILEGGNQSIFGWSIPILPDNTLDANNPSIFLLDRPGSNRSYAANYDFASDSYLLAGSTNSNTNGGFDHYLASVKSDGQINWEKTFGGSGTEEALAITPSKDGGYIIGGYSGFEGNALINVIKTDNKGNLNP